MPGWGFGTTSAQFNVITGRSEANGYPLLGVVHLPGSLGLPGFPGVRAAIDAVLADVRALEEAGFDGVLLENERDVPAALEVSPAQVAWLSRVAGEVRHATALPLGLNVQRIDWRAALGVAAAQGLSFVRLDTFTDRVRMLGVEVSVEPKEVLALRRALEAESVSLWTDVHVKHAELLSEQSLEESARRAAEGGSDAVLVTGPRTGRPPSVEDLDAARRGVAEAACVGGASARHARIPVVIASGLSPSNASALAAHADAALVGTALMDDGRIVPARASAMVEAWRAATKAAPG